MSTTAPEWLDDIRQRLTTEYEDQSRRLATLLAEPSDAAEAHTRDAMIATIRESLEQLSAALLRIDEGRYGKCEECGDPIPRERLEIRPQASFCVPCQRRHDG